MLIYLLKSTLCLLVLFGFYKLVLEKENMHQFKRFYLLGSLLLAFSLPLMSFSLPFSIGEFSSFAESKGIESAKIQVRKITPEAPVNIISDNKQSENYLLYTVWTLYLFGMLIFGVRFYRNLLKIYANIRRNRKIDVGTYFLVLLKERLIPHSFLNYLFVNEYSFDREKIPAEVFLHEEIHIREKHSLDILFIELLQVFFWFNPLFILLKRSVKLNHEFLADHSVLKHKVDPEEYSHLLMSYAGATIYSGFPSALNSSFTKKRILMISKRFSIKEVAVRLGLFVPVLAVCMLFFNNKIIAKPVAAYPKVDQIKLLSDLNILQEGEVISISVNEDQVLVNGKETSLKDFRRVLDDLVQDRSKTEMSNVQLKLEIINPDKDFIDELNREYHKTRLFKMNPDRDLLPGAPPAPPAPPAPGARPARVPHVPNAPLIVEKREVRIVRNGRAPRQARRVEMIRNRAGRPGRMAAHLPPENADFYLNDKKIERKEAVKIMREKKDLEIEIKKKEGERTQVHLKSDS